ncbi:Type III restriction-modification system methylation subunit [hydrothermal vent metagenome]|uniref:Type III restriction-modification system methylation subunit n=1 Tax=hydrothermal vent metagenome TaxID=652676 RepID=A0A3B1DUJ1_9ZZZZ
MNFNEKLENILKQNEKFCSKSGELLKQKIKSYAISFDEVLIGTLLDDVDTREHFFKKISDATVFDYRKFIDFMDDKNFLLDSYTKFSNKVGLTISNKHIKQIDDVVLTFPFKDCILEGGQSKEDEKKKEIFFNETLAKDEINRLFDKKVISNATKYFYEDNEVKETTDIKFTRDKEINKARGLSEDTITDNLIIKGNNLLALHTLKSNFAGKVKLIYIDPPYNTGSDSFGYNDSFNHSTWLTFMKNRIEIAKELLADDGVIFISIDDNELAHLKILMDDVAGLNYESMFHIKVRHENRILRQDNRYQKVIEHLLCYGKRDYNPNRIYLSNNKNKDYLFEIKLKQSAIPKKEKINGLNVEIYKKEDYELVKKNNGSLKEYNIRGSLITQSGSASEFYELNLRNRKSKDGLGALYKVLEMGLKGDGIGYRYIRQPFDINGRNGFYYQGKPIKESTDKGNPYPNYYDFETDFNKSSSEGGIIFRNGKKPEMFMEKIFEIADIKKNDIILDFHLGSGSTVGTCHKLNTQYIGIEQINTQLELTKIRLNNAILGEETKLSKKIKWQGGGEFIYFELDKYNQKFIDDLSKATQENILDIYDEICQKGFLNYDIELKKIKDNFEEFKAFTLEQQKEFLISMLNKNQLYKNLSEIDDENLNVSDEIKELNKSFYNISDKE